MDLERLPPHDLAAEEAVLGSLLLEGEALSRIEDILQPEDFFREAYGWVYAACLALADRDEAINPITVAHELERRGRLEELGGSGELHRLVAQVPTSLHIEHYARIVARTALMRRLIAAAGQIAALGYQENPDVEETLDRAEALIYSLRLDRHGRDFVHIREILGELLEEQVQADRGLLPRIPTGFSDLDRLLGGGLQRTDLVVLASRPGVGKTSLALNIALSAATPSDQHPGARIAVFSLEMSREQLVHRLLSAQSGVDTQKVRQGTLTDEEEQRLHAAMGQLAQRDIYIDDSPLLRMASLRSKARRLHYRHGLDLIIVDYLQLIQSTSPYENRVQEISEISRSLKALAKELEVPVLACAQLSRATELRSPPIPHLADLRESGSIEQDADLVLFIYREDLAFTPEEWERRNPTRPYPRNIAHVIVAKHRHGPLGQVDLYFFDRQAKFGELVKSNVP